MDIDGLMEYLKKKHIEAGAMTRDKMHDWIKSHVWELLMAAYPGTQDLLDEVSDYTADCIYEDLVISSEYGSGLIMEYIFENIAMADDEE